MQAPCLLQPLRGLPGQAVSSSDICDGRRCCVCSDALAIACLCTLAPCATSRVLQACDAHIVQALHELHALARPTQGGLRWCLLDTEVECTALETMLLLCQECGMQLHRFEPAQLIAKIQGANDSISCAPLASVLASRGSKQASQPVLRL